MACFYNYRLIICKQFSFSSIPHPTFIALWSHSILTTFLFQSCPTSVTISPLYVVSSTFIGSPSTAEKVDSLWTSAVQNRVFCIIRIRCKAIIWRNSFSYSVHIGYIISTKGIPSYHFLSPIPIEKCRMHWHRQARIFKERKLIIALHEVFIRNYTSFRVNSAVIYPQFPNITTK